MAFAEWAGIAAPYDRSFGALCACTVPAVLGELGSPSVEEQPKAASRNGLAGAMVSRRRSAAPQGFETRPAAAPQPSGGRLLDAGTGTGSVAVAGARAGWQVDAFDAEPSMVEFAGRRPDAAGIRLAVATLPELPYPDDAFDAVTANFALNHVDHPRAGVAELLRVLKPGGRLVATVWPWRTPTPTGRLWREIQDETGAYPPPGDRLPAGSDFDRSEDGLAGLLAECGLVGVRARRVEFEWRVDAEALWSGVEAGIALIGYAYAAADAASRAAMRAAYDARTPALTGDDGLLHFALSAVLASGTKPINS